MQCFDYQMRSALIPSYFRLFVRGYNFYKEHYIYKVMTNIVNDNCCYIRSKCFPSTKQGTYAQWILMTRQAPYRIHKTNCLCPLGVTLTQR
jgi:hypothetical protein